METLINDRIDMFQVIDEKNKIMYTKITIEYENVQQTMTRRNM